MSSIKSLLQSEKQAVKDYGESILSAKNPDVADTLRHIQSEEKHHAEELSGIAQGNKMAEHKKKHAGHGFKHTHIEHHSDGSHTVHHMHEDGPEHDVKGAVADHDGMMDHIMDHTSAPNPGEADADMGGHGIPPAVAGAAGLPMGPAGA